jgi:hypothetical protein
LLETNGIKATAKLLPRTYKNVAKTRLHTGKKAKQMARVKQIAYIIGLINQDKEHLANEKEQTPSPDT